MQLVNNERRVRREARTGGILLMVTFVLLGLGLLISMQVDNWSQQPWVLEQPWLPISITYGIVFLGMVFYYFGNTRMRRYGPQYRQDARLRQLLKGLDRQHVLYTFLGHGLPDYILIGPGGAYVLIARQQTGEIFCRDNRWTKKMSGPSRIFTLLYGDPLGSPSQEAQSAIGQVRHLLDEKLPSISSDIPITPLIVFTREGVKVRCERCLYQATVGKETRGVIGRGKRCLDSGRLSEVQSLFASLVG